MTVTRSNLFGDRTFRGKRPFAYTLVLLTGALFLAGMTGLALFTVHGNNWWIWLLALGGGMLLPIGTFLTGQLVAPRNQHDTTLRMPNQ